MRERSEDIPLLLAHFTNHSYELSQPCLTILKSYEWPGNIRELINVAHYITTIDESKIVSLENLPKYILNSEPSDITMSDSTTSLNQNEIAHLDAKLKLDWVYDILMVLRI